MSRVKLSLLSLMVCTILTAGCATTFQPLQPEPVQFEKTPEYKIDTSNLDDLLKSAIEKQFSAREAIIHEDGKVEFLEDGSTKIATHVVLLPEEYKEVANIVDIAMAYRDTAIAQQDLINAHISTVNTLKELAELERQKIMIYRDSWVESENMYREERKLRSRENIINDVRFWLVTIGSVAGIALAL